MPTRRVPLSLPQRRGWISCCLCVLALGCHGIRHPVSHIVPFGHTAHGFLSAQGQPLCPLTEARRSLVEAERLHALDQSACVDWYFAAAQWAWQASRPGGADLSDLEAASDCYHRALVGVLAAGTAFGRLDPRGGLSVRQGNAQITVPAVHQFTSWTSADFQQLLEPPAELPKGLNRCHARSGWGVPVVVRRFQIATEQRFLPRQSDFAATAVLRFDDQAGTGAVLEFLDPLRTTQVHVQGRTLALAADLTAPLAQKLHDTPRTYIEGFVEPGANGTTSRLEFLEPYQAGRIPVVFIHGLLSDPQSWANMANDLRSDPWVAETFQLWAFRYPTGDSFLRSAAELRQELAAALHACDPAGMDPALQQVVLIGHSMGGLIAKLQVTYSQNQIWQLVANRPLERIRTTDETRTRLTQLCFFDPSPSVRRVIFIATPHCGATEVSGAVGDFASGLVDPEPQTLAAHRQLIADNPGVFADFVQEELPTSVDLLAADSPLLRVMRELNVSRRVTLHTIYGDLRRLGLDGPSDGVVPVASARHPGAASECAIPESHTRIHGSLDASEAVLQILRQHVAEISGHAGPSAGTTP